MKARFVLIILLFVFSCRSSAPETAPSGTEFARWFSLTDSTATLLSPFGGKADTLRLDRTCSRLVCMSTSHVGYLRVFGADSLVVGVSGLDYVSDSLVRSRAVDVGYDAHPDYEGILSLHPDLLLAYAVSSAEPPYLAKLRSLGLRVLLLNDHLESHPLARAEYIRLFGALTGRRAAADSAFTVVRDRYLARVRHPARPVKVLVNIPYGDQWFIPGADNFLARLVRDAGGEIVGSRPGIESSVVSVETAYRLSRDADCWIHPGWCRTLPQLRSVHPLFSDFPVLGKCVYNNTLRQTPGGGNDFWESGAARPDLVLEDLCAIFSSCLGTSPVPADSLHYYLEVR